MSQPPKPGADPTLPRSLERTESYSLPNRADIMALTGDLAGRRYTMEAAPVVFGRDPDAKIQVASDDVSRRHAQIRRTDGGEFIIEDLGSRNGTLVNGVPVEVHVLKFGDKVQIGSRNLFVFTHHQALEEQLVQWQRIELVAQMTAGLVHDFNNYMAALLGYIQYLQEMLDRSVPEQKLLQTLTTCLPVMESAAREGSNLARKVLTFARGTKRPQIPLDLGPVVEEALALVQRNLGAAIRVEQDLGPGLRIIGERTEMLQVLINLFLNARDAMPDGGLLRVEGRVGHMDGDQALALQANEQVVLKVRDTGQGMDDETQRRIFEPLFTTKAAGKGTGLGLSMVSRIIEGHGGMIRVESKPGQGTEFTLYFPVVEAKITPLKVNTTLVMSHLQGELPAYRGSGVVIVMEDEDLMRQRAARVLCTMGYEVLFASSAAEVLDLIERYPERTKLVVLNLEHGDVEPEKTRQALHAVNPSVRVVCSTRTEQHTTPGGVVRLLRLPCDTRSFKQVMVEVLEPSEESEEPE